MEYKTRTGTKSGLQDWMKKLDVKKMRISLSDPNRKSNFGIQGDKSEKMSLTPKIERVMAVGKMDVGQKVLVYIPGHHDIISSEGTRIGTKRHVQGTGYVDEENGRLVIKSESLGKLKVLSPKEMRVYNKRARHSEIPMVTVIEE